MLQTATLLFSLLPASGSGEEPLSVIQRWRQAPESCERGELVRFLQHEDIRVRSAALDLLESVTGSDFGLDPWLAPADVPEDVVRSLTDWCRVEESLGSSGQPPTQAQLAEAIAVLKTADPDTQRRICLRFARYRVEFVAALQKTIQESSELTPKEVDFLRCAQFRAQLQDCKDVDAGQVASMLTSHSRKNTLEGLELLRRGGKECLPVLVLFSGRENDVLVREVAVDILMELGGTQAFKVLKPMLDQEEDRNILQIASRRAVDCVADPALVSFLNRCALSSDEDISVAGLEALAALSNQDEESLEDGMSWEPLAVTQYLGLLRSPYWRVRAAALAALKPASAPFLPDLSDKALQEAVLGCLKDKDATVRQEALQVLYKRKLAKVKYDELVDFALRSPADAPYIVYLLCVSDSRLKDSLLSLVSRFSPEQVNELASYEAQGERLFTARTLASYGSAPREVLNHLMENPDPRVRRRMMALWGDLLFSLREEWAVSFLDWLKDGFVSEDDKSVVLSRMVTGNVRSVSLEMEQQFISWLQSELDRPGIGKAYASVIYASLLYRDSSRFADLVDRRILTLDGDLVDALVEKSPALFARLDVQTFNELLGKYTLNVCELFRALAMSQEGKALLDGAVLNDNQWSDVVGRLREDESSFLPEWAGILLSKALSDASMSRRRYEAAYALVSFRRGMGEIDEGLVAKLEDELRTFPENLAEPLECLSQCPMSAAEVEPWAKRFAQSSSPCVRQSVACCLLPYEGWLFGLPALDGGGENLYVKAPVRKNADGKRVSCPSSLINLIRTMQRDQDPDVALMACASLLYRTGDCDQERMLALLQDVAKKKKKESGQGDGIDYRIANALDSVWSRWAGYRGSTQEAFKLKGNPAKIKPGVDRLLNMLNEVTESGWRMDDQLREQMGFSLSSASIRNHGGDEKSVYLPHEFTFEQVADSSVPDQKPQAEDSSTPKDEESVTTPDSDGEGDAKDPQPIDLSAPVRVEFFHKEGCDVCARVRERLARLKQEFAGLEVVEYDVESDEGMARNDVLSNRFGVPYKNRHKAPALFAEAGVLLGEKADSPLLSHLLEASIAKGSGGEKLASGVAEKQETLPEGGIPGQAVDKLPKQALGQEADMLAESSAGELQQAEHARIWEIVRSYGMLAIGGLACLLGLMLTLFGRGKSDKNDGNHSREESDGV